MEKKRERKGGALRGLMFQAVMFFDKVGVFGGVFGTSSAFQIFFARNGLFPGRGMATPPLTPRAPGVNPLDPRRANSQ